MLDMPSDMPQLCADGLIIGAKRIAVPSLPLGTINI